jgi:hypothetical protein
VLLRTPVLRRRRRPPDASAPGAGVATALALCAVAVVAWLLNPFAALLLVLPLHCWMLAAITDARPLTRAWLVAIGLLPAALVAGTYMRELSLDPIQAAWYLFLLVTGTQVGAPTALLGCLVCGLFGATAAIAVARVRTRPAPARPEPRPEQPAAFGPASRLEGPPPRGRRSLLRR